ILHVAQLMVAYVRATVECASARHTAGVFSLCGLDAFTPIFIIGISQLVYAVPAIVIAWWRGYRGIVQGLVIGIAGTFILNATCFSLLAGRPMYPSPWAPYDW